MAEMQDRYIPARTIDRPFTENEDGSLDVKILILSGEEMYRDAEGDFVIDLAAVSLHKTTLIMDYNHNESEVIGHITNLRYEDGGLWGDAHLFSARSGDRAEEVRKDGGGGNQEFGDCSDWQRKSQEVKARRRRARRRKRRRSPTRR